MAGRISGWLLLVSSLAFLVISFSSLEQLFFLCFIQLLAIVLFTTVSLRLRNRQVLYEPRGRYSFLVTLFPTGFLVSRF